LIKKWKGAKKCEVISNIRY